MEILQVCNGNQMEGAGEERQKKTKDNNDKTRRASKFFEFETDLDDVYIKKILNQWSCSVLVMQ